MSDDLKEYASLYSKYFSSIDGTTIELDRAFYLRWVRTTTQLILRTPLAFENYIINSPEYNQKLHADFKRIYSYYIEPNCPPTAYEAFTAKYGGHVGRSNLISETSIIAYVKELPVFMTKYKDVIARLYYMVNQEHIPEALLTLYIDKFCTQDYTLEDLNNDITSGRAPTILDSCKGGGTDDKNRNLNVLRDLKSKWAQIHGGIPSSSVLNNLLTQIGDSEFVLTSLIKQFNLFRNKQVNDIQSVFLTCYKREPFVPEFLKIVEHGITDLEAMHMAHIIHYDVVQDLYQNYVAANITEIDFVKRYIYAIDDQIYVDAIIQELTSSAEYEKEMCAVICDAYTGLYDTRLEIDDLAYMFIQIKNKKLSLRSHELSEIISTLKIQTDGYMTSLDGIYRNILTRSPDAYECVHYKQVYRDDHDVKTTEATVLSDLYASLEYHDVLKTKIRAIHDETVGTPLLPSKLFALLNQVLKSTALMRDDSALRALIMQ